MGERGSRPPIYQGTTPAPRQPTFKSFARHPTGQIDPEGPSYAEFLNREQQANKHLRNSPLGFHEPKFKKRWIWDRQPAFFSRAFIASFLLLYFSKPLYDIFLGPPPSPAQIQRAEFLKKQMVQQGLWEFPWNPFKSSKAPQPSEPTQPSE